RFETAQFHLLGKAERRGELADDPGRHDERASAPGPLDPLLAGEVRERATDGDETAAVLTGEFALRWQALADPPVSSLDRGAQVEIDLVVERDRSGLESVACQPCPRRERGPAGWWRSDRDALLIRLYANILAERARVNPLGGCRRGRPMRPRRRPGPPDSPGAAAPDDGVQSRPCQDGSSPSTSPIG